MTEKIYGYNGIILDVDLSSGKIDKKAINPNDLRNFVGGRGLGVKLLWDRLKDKPGTDPLSPENPLMFMAGPFSGFPAPSSSDLRGNQITSPLSQEIPIRSCLNYKLLQYGWIFQPRTPVRGL